MRTSPFDRLSADPDELEGTIAPLGAAAFRFRRVLWVVDGGLESCEGGDDGWQGGEVPKFERYAGAAIRLTISGGFATIGVSLGLSAPGVFLCLPWAGLSFYSGWRNLVQWLS